MATKMKIRDGTTQIMGSYRKGGKVKKTGLYKLHKGEKVVKKKKKLYTRY